MRRVRTASGAVVVQLVLKDRGEVIDIERVGSAQIDAELAWLHVIVGSPASRPLISANSRPSRLVWATRGLVTT